MFWRRKMRTLHNILDVNKDGVISFDDLRLLAAKFTDLGHLSPEMSQEFLKVMQESWEEQFGDINVYNLVTVEQFLTDYHHRLNDPDLSKKVARFLPYLFKVGFLKYRIRQVNNTYFIGGGHRPFWSSKSMSIQTIFPMLRPDRR